MGIKARRCESGFSLIECLAAVAILGIGLAGVIGCLTAALLSNQKASQIELATAVAQDTLEDMRSRGFGSITYDEFPTPETVAGLHAGTRTITITDSYEGNHRLKRVSVTVSWRWANGRSASVTLATVVANRAGHSGSG